MRKLPKYDYDNILFVITHFLFYLLHLNCKRESQNGIISKIKYLNSSNVLLKIVLVREVKLNKKCLYLE